MYVKSVQIRNLRCFESVKLELEVPGRRPASRDQVLPHLPNVTLLLGDNGSGKTTVLRAIALGALAPLMATGAGTTPYSLVRRAIGRPVKFGVASAEILLHRSDSTRPGKRRLELRIAPTKSFHDRVLLKHFPKDIMEAMYDERSPSYFLVGYGATRRVEGAKSAFEARRKDRVLRVQRVAGLFEEHVNLMPLSAWLPDFKRRNKGRHSQVLKLMNELLGDMELTPKTRDGEYLFHHRGADIPFAALSDGYRAYVGWVADLLYHVTAGTSRGERLRETRGVVLVDEIDLHLHPDWQRTVVPTLSRALPNLQFVLTTHSPLVTGSIAGRNVRHVLTRTEKSSRRNSSVIEYLTSEPYGQTADQILTGDGFGLDSTRDVGFSSTLSAAAAKARKGNPKDAMTFMRLLSGGPTAASPRRKKA